MSSRTRADRHVHLGPGHRVRDCRRFSRQGDGARGHVSASQDLRRCRRASSPAITSKRSDIDKVMQRRDARPGRRPRSRQRLSDAPTRCKQVESGSAAAAGRRRPRADASVLSARHRGARQFARGESRPAHRRLHPRDQRQADARDVGVGRHRARCAARRARRCRSPIIRGNAADPHVVELTRETDAGLGGQQPDRGAGRRLRAHRRHRARHRRPGQVADRRAHEERRREADRRCAPRRRPARSTTASRSRGCSSARARSPSASARAACSETIAAAPGDGAITLPAVVLMDTGTSGAAELFAAALVGQQARRPHRRAHDRPRGLQKLIKLPDGSGLWLSTTRYLTPAGAPLHEKGLEPTVPVDEPDVEFGQPAPTADPILDKALERLTREKGRVIGKFGKSGELGQSSIDQLTDYQVTNSFCYTDRSSHISRCRRVAQRLERLLDTQEVGGSSPPVPTMLASR